MPLDDVSRPSRIAVRRREWKEGRRQVHRAFDRGSEHIEGRGEGRVEREKEDGEKKNKKAYTYPPSGLRHVPLVFAGESICAGVYSSVSSASSTVSWQSILSGVHTLSRRNRPITDWTFGCSIPPGKTQEPSRHVETRRRGRRGSARKIPGSFQGRESKLFTRDVSQLLTFQENLPNV